MKEVDLMEGSIFRKLIQFSLPMIAGNLLQQVYNLMDALIVGKCIGADALASVDSAYTLMIFIILEELIPQNLREIVSFARGHKNRFVQMVMDMDVKERNRGLAKKRRLLSESEKRITELDMIFKRLYEDNISGKLTDERFHKLSTDYEAGQAGLQAQAAILREEIEEAEGRSANVDRFLSVVRQYTDIPELTPHILHEVVEKIVIHAATDPHRKINRRQEVDICYKGIGILEMSTVFDSR